MLGDDSRAAELVLVGAAANWGENSSPATATAITNQRIRLLLEADGARHGGHASHARPDRRRDEGVAPARDHVHRAEVGETADPNPFRDYRLTVDFARGGGPSSCRASSPPTARPARPAPSAGDRWQARFLPDAEGDWAFHAELVRGTDVAIRGTTEPGEARWSASPTARSASTDRINRRPTSAAMGLAPRRRASAYFVFAGTNAAVPQRGSGQPGEPARLRRFRRHHARPTATNRTPATGSPGDPVWKGGRGKNLIGALNYLAGKGINAVYFLTMNVKGDGNDVWPWTGRNERFRFDVSKLDQWELVFSHMDRLGIMLHVVHQEQENDQLLDGGELGPERKLYYRELIARFAHHPALVWNLGEENTNTTDQLKSFARYIHDLDPYDHPIVVHTFPSQYDKVYAPLLGDRLLLGRLAPGRQDGALRERSLRPGWIVPRRRADPGRCSSTRSARRISASSPTADDPDHDDVRRHALWSPLMVGGSGAEWLFGLRYPHNDTNLEDFRSRDQMWDQTRWALEFFQHVPVRETKPCPELVSTPEALCLARPGAVYAVYLGDGGTCSLTLEPGRYSVRWFDPRAGGGLQKGTVEELEGAGTRALGPPPSHADRDWAILVRRLDPRSEAQGTDPVGKTRSR